MACQASAREARGKIVSSGGSPRGDMTLVISERGNLLSFWACLCFIFLAITAAGCVGTFWTGPVFTKVFITNTLTSAPGTERGAWRHKRSCLGGGPAAARLCPLLFLSRRSGQRQRRMIQHQLGPGSLALRELAERERCRGSGFWAGWMGEGAGFTSCWDGAGLRRLDAVAEMEHLGNKCCIAWDDFCMAVKRSAKPSTAGPKIPVRETGESRKGTLSASLISVRFSHKWCSSKWKWSYMTWRGGRP